MSDESRIDVAKRPCGCVALARLCEPVVTTRVLVVAAHPDDETIGAGAMLARSVDAHIVIVTDGAPRERSFWPDDLVAGTREDYARIRREELHAALGGVGIGPNRVHLLDAIDGETTEAIPAIVHRLVLLLNEVDPEVVVTHAYEGGHVDHDATALAVHAAMAVSGRGHPHEMALYHGAGGAIAVHEFLPSGPPCRTVHLDERLRARKSRMLERYESQRQYETYFGTDVERYRCAPSYDFRQSPDPAGPLLYERSTTATGERWRARARVAIEELKLVDWLQDRASHLVKGEQEQRENTAVISHLDPAVPLVSVIVRTVGRDTLVQALDSIACQTYPNIEIVLVDVSGHGPPASWKDREGLVLRTRTGIGLDRPKAANAGLNATTGVYITFLDDDDWSHPEHVASLVAALRAASDARVAYTGVEVIEWLDDVSPRRRWVFDSPYDPVALLCENYIPLNAVLFERGLLDEGGQFDEALPLYEDWDFLIWLSRRTRFEKVHGIGAVYRWPPGSGVNDPRRTAVAQERVFTKWRNALSQEEHVGLMRRAIEQTELKDGRKTQMQALQAHLKAQDEELGRLRPHVGIQERQLEQLRNHLQAQDEELERLRPCVTAQREQEALRARQVIAEQETALRGTKSALELRAQEAEHREQIISEQTRVLDEARAALDTLQASASWRLTAPLRRLSRLLSRTR